MILFGQIFLLEQTLPNDKLSSWPALCRNIYGLPFSAWISLLRTPGSCPEVNTRMSFLEVYLQIDLCLRIPRAWSARAMLLKVWSVTKYWSVTQWAQWVRVSIRHLSSNLTYNWHTYWLTYNLTYILAHIQVCCPISSNSHLLCPEILGHNRLVIFFFFKAKPGHLSLIVWGAVS